MLVGNSSASAAPAAMPARIAITGFSCTSAWASSPTTPSVAAAVSALSDWRYLFTEEGLQQYADLEHAFAEFRIELSGGEPLPCTSSRRAWGRNPPRDDGRAALPSFHEFITPLTHGCNEIAQTVLLPGMPMMR